MDIGSTISAKNLPQTNIASPKSHNVQTLDETRLVKVQSVGGVWTAEQSSTPSPLSHRDSKLSLRSKSENVLNFRGHRRTSSLSSVYVPKRHSVNSTIGTTVGNGTIREDENHDGDYPEESSELQGPTSPGAQDTAISPMKFVGRWAKAHLPSEDSSAQIRKKLSESVVRNHLQQRFVPYNKLTEIVTAETVCAELKKSNYSNLRRINARPVTVEDGTKYQKILAILYLIKFPSKIREFIKYGVSDNDLPLVKCENSKDTSYHTLRSGRNCTDRAINFKRQEYIQDFLDNQWRVLAPVFPWTGGKHIWHSRLMPETIIPFIYHERSAQGGYSKVLKTNIHPSHHQFDNQGNVFAVKVLRECDEEAFKQEAVILGRFSNPHHSHKHLITLLATFEYEKVFHFIFPWADADLFTFWKKQCDPPNDDKMETWIIEQCHGLAEALNTIHRYETMSGTTLIDHISKQVDGNGKQQTFQIEIPGTDNPLRNLFGRHGDLKPENILWFPYAESSGSHGILKITDFGATRFNTVNLWDTRKTGRIPNSATYRSPEIDLHGRLTTACDVWALGCVYLQFITWFCGGNSRLEDFGQRRLTDDPRLVNMPSDTFFSLVQEGEVTKAEVKPAVVDEIKQLQDHPRCTDEFRNLLDIIQEDMLVVHQQEASSNQETITPGMRRLFDSTPSNALDPIVTKRKSCGNIWRRLGDIKPTKDSEGNLMVHRM